MYCNNCGEKGHISRNCHKPITSYGVLLYTYINDIPKIVMIQRKDSLCYIEIIRGKYNIKDINRLKLLLTRISIEEKNNILTKDFDDLWKELWLINEIKETKYMKEYNKSKKLFNYLKNGYNINNKQYSFNILFNNIENNYLNSEWEFPKGKKNLSESYLEAAERELQEETNINKKDYDIIKNIHQFTEEFKGENNIKYRNIYYIGKCKNINNIFINKDNKNQTYEIKNVKLLTKQEAIDNIRDYNITKIIIIEKIFNFIEKYNNDFTIE